MKTLQFFIFYLLLSNLTELLKFLVKAVGLFSSTPGLFHLIDFGVGLCWVVFTIGIALCSIA